MTHYIELAKEKIESLDGQMRYAKNKLIAGGLQAWEAKEWSAMVDDLTMEIAKATNLHDYLLSL